MQLPRHSVPLALALLALVSACDQEGRLEYDESIRPLGKHPVLVFGIDGATWDVLEPMIAAGQLPNLAALRERSLHGVLESELPSNSPVVWSTIFTGKQPHQHGVRDWTRSQSTHRRVKALWEITSETGLVTHTSNVPSSWPPVPIRGRMLSGFPLSGSTIGSGTGELIDLAAPTEDWSPAVTDNLAAIQARADELAAGAWSGWFDGVSAEDPAQHGRLRIKRLDDTRVYVSPIYRTDAGLVYSYPPEWQAQVAERLGETYIPEGPGWSDHALEEVPGFLYDHLAQVAAIQTEAALLLVGEPWNLLIYVSTLVDRTSHPYWPYRHPEDYPELDPELARLYGDRVERAYLETDVQLGRFLAAVPDDAYVLIVSDHGFASDLEGEKDELEGIHHEDGIYLLAGPGIAVGQGPRANIEDVGPTVLHLLGLPVGADMLGVVLPPVAEADLGHPLRTVETYETGRSYRDGEREAVDASVDHSTWEQLRDLGYVDGDSPEED